MRQLEISIMIFSNSATASNGHIKTAAQMASSCTYLRIRLIVIFVLILAGNHSVYVDSTVDLYEFRAFADFLAQQHLRHAIIAYNGKTSKSLQQQDVQHLEKANALRALFDITTLHFYDAHHASKNPKTYKHFKNLFLYNTPRVGIYLTQLEDSLLQEHVLGTKYDRSAVSLRPPDLDGNSGSTFLRFNYSHAWFIMSKEQSVRAALSNIRKVMTPLLINISADITLGVHSDSNNTIQLFDIYKVQTYLLEIEEKGYWNPTKGIQLEKRFYQSFVRRRRNFKGLQLRGAIVIREKPDDLSEWNYLNSLDYKKLDPMQRKSYQMLRMLEPMFNVRLVACMKTNRFRFFSVLFDQRLHSFRAILTPLWGKHWSNGSWDGVMEMVLNGEAELSMCPVRFDFERVHLIHFSSTIHTEYILFLFRHPRESSIRETFSEPFMKEVWYAISAFCILATLLLLLQIHYEHRFCLNKDPHFQCSFDYAVLSISKAFFQQGPDTNAFASTSTRLLIFCICILSMLVQQFYGGYIVGSLLSVAPRTITNLEALYNSSIEIGMENIPYNFDFFKNSPLANNLYTSRLSRSQVRHILTIEEGAERIKKGGFAFHVSANRMYHLLQNMLTEKEFCDLQEVSFLPPFDIGIAVGKLSAFREYFLSSILRWRTTGLIDYSNQQWQIPHLDCSLIQKPEIEVDLEHFLPALFLLCAGMVLSVCILVIEIIYYNFESGLNLERFCPSLLSEPTIEFTN